MKVKKVNKKLLLNKKTIASLADSEQMLILGGDTFTITCTEAGKFTCTSCDFSCPDIGTCAYPCITGGTGGGERPD